MNDFVGVVDLGGVGWSGRRYTENIKARSGREREG